MALGATARRILGPRLARKVGRAYRAIFVDLDKEARALATVIPARAHVLDIGGGDGEPLNYLLALRPDLHITTIDPGPAVGQWIAPKYDLQVTRIPGMSIEGYLASGQPDPDVLLIADVVHHIPVSERGHFLNSVEELLDRVPSLRIVVKDVEPGSPRALLGYWSDLWITGDRTVSPIARARLVRLFVDTLGPLRHEETALFVQDKPNYVIAFFR